MITKSPSQCDKGSLTFSTPADQEQITILRRLEMNRNKRGGTRKGKSARRHKNRRAKRKNK